MNLTRHTEKTALEFIERVAEQLKKYGYAYQDLRGSMSAREVALAIRDRVRAKRKKRKAKAPDTRSSKSR